MLLFKVTYNKYICRKKEKQQYSAVTKIARMRGYTMLSTIFKCQEVPHTLSALEGWEGESR